MEDKKMVEYCFIPFKCVHCGREVDVHFTRDQLDKWETGDYDIQDCFPDLTPGEREMFLSGICDDCWQKLMPNEIEELLEESCDPEELKKLVQEDNE